MCLQHRDVTITLDVYEWIAAICDPGKYCTFTPEEQAAAKMKIFKALNETAAPASHSI
jgi:hypothetical protein